jgi:hypothetical protein
MPNPLDGWDARGTRLSLEDYRADFRATESMITGQHSWKLERRQHFRQPGSASWEAFTRGQWAEALQHAAFVDRQEAIALLNATLVGGDPRRAVIVEMPGAGKTTLAVHWAYRNLPSYPDADGRPVDELFQFYASPRRARPNNSC